VPFGGGGVHREGIGGGYLFENRGNFREMQHPSYFYYYWFFFSSARGYVVSR
jgi:hypothetical protein